MDDIDELKFRIDELERLVALMLLATPPTLQELVDSNAWMSSVPGVHVRSVRDVIVEIVEKAYR